MVLAELLDQEGNFGRKILNINYDTYAEGEAELGWLNSTVKLIATTPFDLSETLLNILEQIGGRLETQGAEIAHIKAIANANGKHDVIASITQSGSKPELSQATVHKTSSACITFNARVVIDPEILSHIIETGLDDECKKRGIKYQITAIQHLRPGRPVPTHRYSKERTQLE